jgi:hypothetical protein
MNSEAQNPDLPKAEPNPEPEVMEFPFSNRHTGKVARMCKAARDRLNLMMLDGLPYAQIIEELGEEGKDLKPDNLYQHRKGAYQEWLQQREWLGKISAKTDFSTDLLAQPGNATIHEAGLRFAAAQMLDQLMALAPANPANGGGTQPETLARLVNALSRLTREALAFQKYHDLCAKTVALELKKLDPNREFNDREDQILTERMDKFFKKRRPKPPTPVASNMQNPPAPEPPPNGP